MIEMIIYKFFFMRIFLILNINHIFLKTYTYIEVYTQGKQLSIKLNVERFLTKVKALVGLY